MKGGSFDKERKFKERSVKAIGKTQGGEEISCEEGPRETEKSGAVAACAFRRRRALIHLDGFPGDRTGQIWQDQFQFAISGFPGISDLDFGLRRGFGIQDFRDFGGARAWRAALTPSLR